MAPRGLPKRLALRKEVARTRMKRAVFSKREWGFIRYKYFRKYLDARAFFTHLKRYPKSQDTFSVETIKDELDQIRTRQKMIDKTKSLANKAKKSYDRAGLAYSSKFLKVLESVKKDEEDNREVLEFAEMVYSKRKK